MLAVLAQDVGARAGERRKLSQSPRSRCKRWELVSLLCMPCLAYVQGAFAVETPPPPTDPLNVHDFVAPTEASSFSVQNGNWQVSAGTYSNTGAGATNVTVLQRYQDVNPTLPDSTSLLLPQYTYHARMRNRTSSDSVVGLTFEYRDASNYYELVFSPIAAPKRMAFLRRVEAGVTTTVASAAYAEGGPDLWFDVDLERNGSSTTVFVNGNRIFSNVQQPRSSSNRIGLITHNAIGEFDDFRVYVQIDAPAFKESFEDGIAQGFQPQSGTWRAANGIYENSVGNSTGVNLTSASISSMVADVGFRARMFNPYGAAGNLVGIAFNYGSSNYDEVVFSNTGAAQVRHVRQDGSVTTLASATIPKLSSQWFETAIHLTGNLLEVALNDKTIFSMNADKLSFTIPNGPIGLVTHFSPGQFDDVAFQYSPFPKPYSENFSTSNPAIRRIDSGTWAANNGTYESLATGPKDMVSLYFPSFADIVYRSSYSPAPDFIYRAKVQITGAGANALAGVFTDYDQSTGEYYETLFSPTGQVLINKIVQGTTVRQATGTYAVGSSPWIDVEIRRVGTSTSLQVNGKPIFSGVLQGQLISGEIGFITHGTQAKFDDVSWKEFK